MINYTNKTLVSSLFHSYKHSSVRCMLLTHTPVIPPAVPLVFYWDYSLRGDRPFIFWKALGGSLLSQLLAWQWVFSSRLNSGRRLDSAQIPTAMAQKLNSCRWCLMQKEVSLTRKPTAMTNLTLIFPIKALSWNTFSHACQQYTYTEWKLTDYTGSAAPLAFHCSQ